MTKAHLTPTLLLKAREDLRCCALWHHIGCTPYPYGDRSCKVCMGLALLLLLLLCSPAMVPVPFRLPCNPTAHLPLRSKILNATEKHLTAVWWLVCRDRPPACWPELSPLLPCVLLCLYIHLFPIFWNCEIMAGTIFVLWLYSTCQRGFLSVPGAPRKYANSITMMVSEVKGGVKTTALVAKSPIRWGRSPQLSWGSNSSRCQAGHQESM